MLINNTLIILKITIMIMGSYKYHGLRYNRYIILVSDKYLLDAVVDMEYFFNATTIFRAPLITIHSAISIQVLYLLPM